MKPRESAEMISSPAYQRELEVAERAARAAGEILRSIFRTQFNVERKPGDEPVTEADRKANRSIVETLTSEFPGDSILAEESEDDFQRLVADRVWMVDPMDGTNEFIDGKDEFAVMIGLCEKGKPVAGVVYQPLADLLYYASKNGGAYLVDRSSTRPLKVSGESVPERSAIAVSRSHRSRKIDALKAELGIEREHQSGSVGLKVGLVVRKMCDLYVHTSGRSKQWDTCAPEIILTEAGGRMTTTKGEEIVYNTRDVLNHDGIVASNSALHDRIIEAIDAAIWTRGENAGK